MRMRSESEEFEGGTEAGGRDAMAGILVEAGIVFIGGGGRPETGGGSVPETGLATAAPADVRGPEGEGRFMVAAMAFTAAIFGAAFVVWARSVFLLEGVPFVVAVPAAEMLREPDEEPSNSSFDEEDEAPFLCFFTRFLKQSGFSHCVTPVVSL